MLPRENGIENYAVLVGWTLDALDGLDISLAAKFFFLDPNVLRICVLTVFLADHTMGRVIRAQRRSHAIVRSEYSNTPNLC